MSNLLITTLGTSWQIVPELYGFTNPQQLDLYRHHPARSELDKVRREHGIEPVAEIWIITTEKMSLDSLRQWAMGVGIPLKIWWPQGVDEIATADENARMADLIYRCVLHGKEQVGTGTLYLSLAGGRKTMSAEMQQAGMLLGCAALLHVVDRRQTEDQRKQLDCPKRFLNPLSAEMAALFQPLVIMPAQPANVVLEVDPPIRAQDYPLPVGGEARPSNLYQTLHKRLKRAESLMYNFSSRIDDEHHQSSFHGLYSLPPELVRHLTTERIAADRKDREADLAWLQRLPKADLHCHLGGVLDAEGMIEVADAMAEDVAVAAETDVDFGDRLHQIQGLVDAGDAEAIRCFLAADRAEGISLLKVPRSWHRQEPYGVCGFLLAFAGAPDLLDRVIYGELLDPRSFLGIGIERYEGLGDLQGSALLQHEATLRRAVAVLKHQLEQDNIRYLELRCSPNNYTRGGLSARRVVEILLEEFEDVSNSKVRLIFIASRHRKTSEALQHIELAEALLHDSRAFRRMFAGFDLAGDESKRSPAQMRGIFMPLLEKCIPMTIHAGEDRDVKNIWEAVYELSADRIGHGLTLKKDGDLLKRFVERRIAVEMCPSSNFQIVGFTDHMLETTGDVYPLQEYLDKGLRVTINTDNPGISRTTLSHEFYKAAAMVEGGLSRWQILQLVRNSFQAAFCPRSQRRDLMRRSEQQIVELLTRHKEG